MRCRPGICWKICGKQSKGTQLTVSPDQSFSLSTSLWKDTVCVFNSKHLSLQQPSPQIRLLPHCHRHQRQTLQKKKNKDVTITLIWCCNSLEPSVTYFISPNIHVVRKRQINSPSAECFSTIFINPHNTTNTAFDLTRI